MNLKDFNSKLKDSAQFNINKKVNDIDVTDYLANHSKPIYKNHFNRVALSALSVAFALIIAFTVYFNLKPISVLTIDFNPSIELELNRFNRVISIDATNADAEAFISQLDYKNKKIDKVVESIYDLGLDKDYFTEDEAYMLIGIYGEDFKSESKISTILSSLNQITFLTLTEHDSSQTSQLMVGEMQIDYMLRDTTESFDMLNPDVTGTVEADVNTSNNAVTFDKLIVLASDYQVSQTKINIAYQIYNAYDEYSTQTDFEYLVYMDISDLIILFNNIE